MNNKPESIFDFRKQFEIAEVRRENRRLWDLVEQARRIIVADNFYETQSPSQWLAELATIEEVSGK